MSMLLIDQSSAMQVKKHKFQIGICQLFTVFMGNAMSKDGWLTTILEVLPGGGLITCGFHFARGDHLEGAMALGFGLLSIVPAAKGLATAATSVLKAIKSTRIAGLVKRAGKMERILYRSDKFKKANGQLQAAQRANKANGPRQGPKNGGKPVEKDPKVEVPPKIKAPVLAPLVGPLVNPKRPSSKQKPRIIEIIVDAYGDSNFNYKNDPKNRLAFLEELMNVWATEKNLLLKSENIEVKVLIVRFPKTQSITGIGNVRPRQDTVSIACIGWSKFEDIYNSQRQIRQITPEILQELVGQFNLAARTFPNGQLFFVKQNQHYLNRQQSPPHGDTAWKNYYILLQNDLIRRISPLPVTIFTLPMDCSPKGHLGEGSKPIFCTLIWNIIRPRCEVLLSRKIGQLSGQQIVNQLHNLRMDNRPVHQNLIQSMNLKQLGHGMAAAVYQHPERPEQVIKAFYTKKEYQIQKQIHSQVRNILGKNPIKNCINLMLDSNDERNWIFLPKMDGLTLEQYIIEKDDLTLQQARKWSSYLCELLRQMHKAGIGHGDFKAKNLMIRDEDLVVCDLGMVHIFGDKQHPSRLVNKRNLRFQKVETDETLVVETKSSDFQQLAFIVMQMYFGVPFANDSNPDCALMFKMKNKKKNDNIDTHDINLYAYDIPQINELFQDRTNNKNRMSYQIVNKFIRNMFPSVKQCTTFQGDSKTGESIVVPNSYAQQDRESFKNKLSSMNQENIQQFYHFFQKVDQKTMVQIQKAKKISDQNDKKKKQREDKEKGEKKGKGEKDGKDGNLKKIISKMEEEIIKADRQKKEQKKKALKDVDEDGDKDKYNKKKEASDVKFVKTAEKCLSKALEGQSEENKSEIRKHYQGLL